MKVTCEYCGCYVEADENMKCPNCVAGLGSAVQAERERIAAEEEAERQRIAAEEEAERQREADAKAQEAKAEHITEVIKGITTVASAVIAGNAASKEEKNATKVKTVVVERPATPHGGPVHHDHVPVPNEPLKHARVDMPDKPGKHVHVAGNDGPGGHGAPGGGPGGHSAHGGPGSHRG